MRLIQVFQSETRISYCWISYTWSLIFQLIEYILYKLTDMFCSPLVPSCILWISGRRDETWYLYFFILCSLCILSCALSLSCPTFFHPLCRPTQLRFRRTTKMCVLEAVPTWTCWTAALTGPQSLPLQISWMSALTGGYRQKHKQVYPLH